MTNTTAIVSIYWEKKISAFKQTCTTSTHVVQWSTLIRKKKKIKENSTGCCFLMVGEGINNLILCSFRSIHDTKTSI